MNLAEIKNEVSGLKLDKEIDFHNFIAKWCKDNKTDLVENSTVYVSNMGNKVIHYSNDDFIMESTYKTAKKESNEQANKRFLETIKKQYIGSKDFVLLTLNFWGMINCRFYDFKTNETLTITT